MQGRKGPNKPGNGLLVPFADAIKLVTKENNVPYLSNRIFLVIPVYTLIIPILLWGAYPSLMYVMKYSVLWFLAVSCVGVFALLGAGWCSNRKYSFFGAVRSVAQSISYEACLTIVVLHYIIYFFYSYTLKIEPLIFLFVVFFVFFVCCLAETNRSPFDFSEGESELVSGFNTEYRSVPFVIIFLAEYISILFISTIISVLFIRNYGVFLIACIWAFLFV